MRSGRFSLLLIVGLLFCIWAEPAHAGWFSGKSEWEKSGLDLDGGFDRNTVTTITGRITRIVTESSDGPVLADLQQGNDLFVLILGPKEFLRRSGIPLIEGSEATVRGSLAMGRNGKSYLIVEKIASGEQEVRLRSETGHSSWSGRGMDRQRPMQMRQQFRGGRMGR